MKGELIMALRNIVKTPDDILKKKSRNVEVFDKKLHTLLDDMAETMEEANGVGLAAVQVGILRKVFIVDIGEGITEYINPEIISTSGTQSDREGCLSFPGQWGTVTRPMHVTIKAYDRNGNEFIKKADGLEARAILHENDHLNGHCFIEIAEDLEQE